MRLLLVEDEYELARVVRDLLIKCGYTVDHAPDLSWATEAVQQSEYDLVVLDRRLPDGDGQDLIQFSKTKSINTRFLIVSALGDVDDKIDSLDLGGDDYLVKPFEPQELLARIRALLRRSLAKADQAWACGELELDVASRSVRIRDHSLALSRRELAVLECLISAAGRVVTRAHLENAVFGYDDMITSNTLESHISRLRKTLLAHQAGISIRAIRGVGYMMAPLDA